MQNISDVSKYSDTYSVRLIKYKVKNTCREQEDIKNNQTYIQKNQPEIL
jgi:hypothetical protein